MLNILLGIWWLQKMVDVQNDKENIWSTSIDRKHAPTKAMQTKIPNIERLLKSSYVSRHIMAFKNKERQVEVKLTQTMIITPARVLSKAIHTKTQNKEAVLHISYRSRQMTNLEIRITPKWKETYMINYHRTNLCAHQSYANPETKQRGNDLRFICQKAYRSFWEKKNAEIKWDVRNQLFLRRPVSATCWSPNIKPWSSILYDEWRCVNNYLALNINVWNSWSFARVEWERRRR